MIGKTISHYRILEELGRGGMGVVYKAEDTKLKRKVALKFLRAQAIVEEEDRTRFIREAQAAAALDHPNICTVYEVGEADDQTYISMAYIEGESLRERLSSGSFSLIEALDYSIQAAKGLRAAHDKGIVHRDIKSANLMLTPDGMIKVMDFGLAKAEGMTKVTKTGTTMGTVAYMSPEQALGQAADDRSDIWSLGVVLYEMLTGELPFKGEYDPALLYSIVNEEPEPVTDRWPDIPLEVEEVVLKALAKDPAKRYESADDYIDALEELREGLHLLPKRGRLQLRLMRQRRRIAWIAGVCLVGLVAAVILYRYVIVQRRALLDQVPEISPNVIAVLPFSVRGGEGTDYLDEAMVDLLSTKLSGVGGLRSVDQHALLSYTNALGEGPFDVESGRAVAEHFGASLYILGSVLAVGSDLNISARLYDPSGGTEVVVKEVEGKIDELISLVNRLAVDLLSDRIDELGEGTERLNELSSSFPAIKAYLEGETLYRRGRFAEAADAYLDAIEEDSLFSLAHLRFGQAASFSPAKFDIHKQGFAKANELKARLPERERLYIEAYHRAWVEMNAEEGLPLLENVVRRYPDYIEGWYWLGEIQFQYGKRHNIGLDEARHSLERALSLDPEFLPAAMMMHWLAGAEEKTEECIAWAKRRLELAPEGDYSFMLRAELAFIEGDEQEQREMLEPLLRSRTFGWVWTDLASFYGDYHGPKALLHSKITTSTPPDKRAGALIGLAYLEISRGKWRSADSCLAEAEKLIGLRSSIARAVLSILPYVQRPVGELESVRNKIAEFALETRGDTLQSAYALGLLNARIGDHEAALENAALLDGHLYAYRDRGHVYDWKHVESVFGHNTARCIRAEVARLQGNGAEALAEAENILPDLWTVPNPGNIIWSNAYGRYLRALLLEEAGRTDEALRWYGSLGMPEAGEFVYSAFKHRKMGEIYEQLGEREKAIEHYERFTELFAECDEEFRPLVTVTERKLAELSK